MNFSYCTISSNSCSAPSLAVLSALVWASQNWSSPGWWFGWPMFCCHWFSTATALFACTLFRSACYASLCPLRLLSATLWCKLPPDFHHLLSQHPHCVNCPRLRTIPDKMAHKPEQKKKRKKIMPPPETFCIMCVVFFQHFGILSLSVCRCVCTKHQE